MKPNPYNLKKAPSPRQMLNYLRSWYPRLLKAMKIDMLIVDNKKKTLTLWFPERNGHWDSHGYRITYEKPGSVYVVEVWTDGEEELVTWTTRHESLNDWLNEIAAEVDGGWVDGEPPLDEYREEEKIPRSEHKDQYRFPDRRRGK